MVETGAVAESRTTDLSPIRTEIGLNVIIPDYRLYPLVRFPDIRDDAIKALEQADDLVRDSDLYLMGTPQVLSLLPY